jgi:hypothetical protein
MTERRTAIWPLVLLWYTLFLPPQVAIDVAGNSIYGYRFAIIIGLPVVLQQLAKAQHRLTLADILLFISGITMILSISYNQGVEVGAVKGGPLLIDLVGSYIVARGSIRTTNDFKRVLIWMAPAFLVAGLLVMAESVSHGFIVKPIADALFGARSFMGTALEAYEQRFGLTRGMGPFAHPILAGLCLSLALPLYWGLSHRDDARMPRLLGLAASGMAIFSVSSTAFLSLAISLILLAYNALARRVAAARWDLFVAICVVAATTIQFGYDGGLLKFVIRIAVSGQSAWYRYAEWQYGGISVSQHPIFGTGISPWSRPSWMVSETIDSLWLLLAINYGLICCLSYMIFASLAVINISIEGYKRTNQERVIMQALAYALTSLIISGFFTSFFGGMQIWLPLLAGAAISLAQPRLALRG